MLVATTVIEVGVDVPNATVMIVEDADRFGLLAAAPAARPDRPRRRARRGASCSPTRRRPTAEARLEAMATSTDGFELAERDLEIRGAGEVFGERQAGLQRPQARPAPARRGRRDRGARRRRARSSTPIPTSRATRSSARRSRTSSATPSSSSSRADGASRGAGRLAGSIAGEPPAGVRLVAPAASASGRRPTGCAEALFSTLGARRLGDASVLDLYAGSGALAIEALSRGAARAVLVDRDRAAVDACRAQPRGDRLRRPRPGSSARPSRRSLAGPRRPRRRSTSCFCDPPYDDADGDARARCSTPLAAPGWLAPARTRRGRAGGTAPRSLDAPGRLATRLGARPTAIRS